MSKPLQLKMPSDVSVRNFVSRKALDIISEIKMDQVQIAQRTSTSVSF